MPPTLTEAVLPHLATKADVAELRADLTKQIAESETRVVRWIIASVSLAVAIVTVINRVMG